MKDFKFFKGTLNVMDDVTRATASFNDDTPEGHMNRRALYHTNRDLYDRLRHPNNEMEQYLSERNWSLLGTPERHQDILRRINEQRDLNDNPIRLSQTTTVTKVKETFWDKFKIVMKESWVSDPFGVTYVSVLATLVTIIVIAKILSIW